MATCRAAAAPRTCRTSSPPDGAAHMTIAGNVAGILLAAGDGSRLGQPKALVMLGGQSLARRGVTLLHDGGTDPVIVVTGAAKLTSDGPGLAGIVTAHNPHWRTGMGSSLTVGLSAVPAGCTAAVLALADQPLVGAQSVRRLLAAYAGGASVAVACYDGQPRNPVLIGREHWPDVIRLADGDVGARPFLRAYPELVTRVDCSETGRPDDIDTPDDLDRIARLLANRTPLSS
jgi:CTP:molybdopterin cytidylyltransferase MocA